jgi:uncharacterized protein with PIN domain
MNDRCPVCHKFVLLTERRIVVSNGVGIVYCRDCYKMFFEGEDDR